jgi:hypothetical protein
MKISCICSHDLWKENMDTTLCVWLEEETWKWFLICDAVVRKKTLPLKAGLKTVSEVQESI